MIATVVRLLYIFIHITLVRSADPRGKFQRNCKAEGVEILSLYGVSLKSCREECDIRPGCLAVSYFRPQLKCVFLNNDAIEETDLSNGDIDTIMNDARSSRKVIDFIYSNGYVGNLIVHVYSDSRRNSCIKIRKRDIESQPRCNCTVVEVCQPNSSQCTIRECPPFGNMSQGVVLGNGNQVGWRLKVECHPGYLEVTGHGGTECLPDGSWSQSLVVRR